MHKRSYYIINSITLYRLIAAPILVVLIFTNNFNLFKWLLPLSFFTDLIDGFLARRYKVSSKFGSLIDSIGDDLTIIAGIIGVFVFKKGFIQDNFWIVITLIVLLGIQNISALIKYRKLSSFHTYLAKVAAIIQGSFLILIFLLPEPIYPLFYVAAIISALDLIEEIILVVVLSKWKTDVKGLYWVFKNRKLKSTGVV